jgi:hypothetical protein
MAIVSNINNEDDEEVGMNVLGDDQNAQDSTPSSSNQDSINVSGGPSTSIGGDAQQVNQAPSAKAGKSKGSGMFTDISKYSRANAPQSQALSGAVQKNVGQEAQKIGQQIEQQQKTYQQRVAEQRARQKQAGSFAQKQIQSAQQGQDLADQDVSRFQNLTGGDERFDQPGQINVTQQDLASKKLARKASLAETATGASDLLRDTFGNRRYTRGQQSLDSLILGADRGARQDLTENVQQQAQGLTGSIRDARQQSLAEAANLAREQETFQTGLQSQLGGARKGVEQDIDTRLTQAQQELDNKQAAFQTALSSGKLSREDVMEFIDQKRLDEAAIEYEKNKADLMSNVMFKPGYEDYEQKKVAYDDIMGDVLTAGSAINRVDSDKYGSYDEFIEAHTDPTMGMFYDNLTDKLSPYMNKDQVYQYMNEAKLAGQPMIKQIDDRIKRTAISEGRAGQDRVSGFDIGGVLQRELGKILQDKLGGIQTRTGETSIQEFLDAQNQERRRDLGSYLDTPEALTKENIMTKDIQARQQALATLAGRRGEGLTEIGPRVTSPGDFDMLKAMKKLGIKGY